MLKIKVFVNQTELDEVCIWNVSQQYGKGVQVYQVFDAKMHKLFKVNHKYEHGYWKLIQKVVANLKDKPQKQDKSKILFEKILNEMLSENVLPKKTKKQLFKECPSCKQKNLVVSVFGTICSACFWKPKEK